jgi:hypothetical protein
VRDAVRRVSAEIGGRPFKLTHHQSVGLVAGIGSAVVVGSLWGIVRTPALAHVEQTVPAPSPPT